MRRSPEKHVKATVFTGNQNRKMPANQMNSNRIQAGGF
jgi:hypothetical protein